MSTVPISRSAAGESGCTAASEPARGSSVVRAAASDRTSDLMEQNSLAEVTGSDPWRAGFARATRHACKWRARRRNWIALSTQHPLHPVSIELAFESSHGNRCDRIADEIDQRSPGAHEAVDAENEGHARKRYGGDHGQCPDERDESGTGNAAGTLRSEHRDAEDRKLLSQAEVDLHRLCNEQRRERHVNAGAVRIENETGRHHETDDRLGAAKIRQLLHERRQRYVGGACSEREEQLLLQKAPQPE